MHVGIHTHDAMKEGLYTGFIHKKHWPSFTLGIPTHKELYKTILNLKPQTLP